MKNSLALWATFALLFIATFSSAQSVDGIVTHATCGQPNGSIDIWVNGGVSPFTYIWSNGANTQDITNLNTGIYIVTVTGANGGSAVKGFQVNQSGGNPPAAWITGANLICGNGTTTLTANGNGTYLWSTGSTSQNINVGPGSYAMTVTNASGCTAVASVSVGVAQPPTATISGNLTVCSGSTTTLTANGNGTYLWSTGSTSQNINVGPGSYAMTVTNASGCTAVASVSVLATGGINPNMQGTCDGFNTTNLAPGTYTVLVTNANGCTSMQTVVVACNLTVSASVTNVTCNGSNSGAVNLSVTGGTMPYSYHWNTGSSAQNLSNLPAGTYTVTVTDAVGSTKTTSATITQPSAITVSANVTNVSTNGGNNGAINLNVNGGTPGYSFHWSNGWNTQNILNLMAGTYTVTVTDVNMCTTTISANVSQPDPCVPPLASFAASSPNGLTAHCANLSTGTGPLQYHWWWGDGTESFEQNPTHVYQTSGMYLITLETSNACGSDTETKNLLVSGSPTPVVEPNSGDISLTIFPNPADQFVTVTFDDFSEAKNVYLFNETGQLLAGFGKLNSGEQIDVQDFPKGTYFISFDFEGKTITRKLIKQGAF